MSAPSTSTHPISSSPSTNNGTFEFTKRKRWADLLVTEIADANLFILSSSFRILYCGGAVTELLGWREVDIVDHDFGDIVSSDDQNHFRACFDDSIRRRSELITYVRLRCNTPAVTFPYSPVKEVLFEVKGYPKFVNTSSMGSVGGAGNEAFFFALAKPYLSRNTAMLNTVLDLQLEHEHLQRKLRALKLQCATSSTMGLTSILSSNGSSSGIYTSTGMDTFDKGKGVGMGGVGAGIGRGSFDAGTGSVGVGAGSAGGAAEDEEDGGKRKKPKKSHGVEQYVCVTCGRTDSPEWRKGPLGPKTLCNACGLRWAKQQRKTDDVPVATSGTSGGGDGGEGS
ncbi:white collar 2 type of transcription factor [Paramarasmius palmivorus]|uniref:White collar 2 type of transcription factor n=1 Tax=Paramarasmius palmivorus TaxID=297713 RepID=A0AAW0CNI3_9AGAR